MRDSKQQDRLADFKDKFQRSLDAYDEYDKFREREDYYAGKHDLGPGKTTKSKWNITAELIESQTDNTIPIPQVRPQKQDERHKANAKRIVDMINCELDRLPSEQLNDIDERMCKVDGATVTLVEWDTSVKTHDSVGDVSVRLLNARQFIPQQAVDDITHMDYMFLTFDDTKDRIKKRYGKDVEDESIDTSISDASTTAEDVVTQIVCYYLNSSGGLGCFSWVGSTVLIDDDNYEARKDKVCAACGKVQAEGEKVCICGCSEWVLRDKDYETLTEDIKLSDGRIIPAYSPARDEAGGYVMEDYQEPTYTDDGMPVMNYVLDGMGMPQYDEGGNLMGEPVMQTKQRVAMEPTKIPYYYPHRYPISIRKNISQHQNVIGISDIDLIKDHQLAIDRLMSKVDEVLLKSARCIPVMRGNKLTLSDETYKIIEVEPAVLASFKSVDLTLDTSQLVAEIQQRYFMAKSTLGITDSFQGKSDSTAISARAKEAQIAQAAGRQRSKQVMKNAAAAEIYEMMFKYMLAYSDEPRNFSSLDIYGTSIEAVFNKYDFLEQDEYGNWYYDDDYIFSVDESGVNATNKQFMLEDLRTDFGLGAYGDPSDPDTVLKYWQEKEVLGYPNAARQMESWQTKVKENKNQQAIHQLNAIIQAQQMGISADQMQQLGVDPQTVMDNMPEQESPVEDGINKQDVMTQETIGL